MRKRFMAAALAAVMTASALTGCGSDSAPTTAAPTAEGSEAEGTQGAGEEDTKAEDTEAEDTGEKETLVVGLQGNTNITDFKDNYLTKLLEEELNCNLEIYEFAATGSDLETQVSLMASGGSGDVPDVILYKGFTPETVLNYGTNGFFIPLNDYYERTDTNYAQLPEEDKEVIEKAMTLADGNMYALPNYSESPWNDTSNRLFINTAWLDKLGLEIPTTTDELYEVLKAFVNNDPNGNGVKDEIGLYGFTEGGYGQDIVDTIMNAFVFYNGGSQNGGLALDETGETVVAPFTSEEWREGLRYFKKLYDEGLMPSSVFTDDDTQFKATLNSETNIVGMVSAGSKSNWTDCDNNPNFLELTMIEPMTGPDGLCYSPYAEYSPEFNLFVTSSCENVDLALELGDWFMTIEHSRYGRYGEKGVDWTDDPEVCAEYSNAYVEAGYAEEVTGVYQTNIWSEPNNKFWQNINPYYSPLEGEMSMANGLTPFDENAKSSMLEAYNLEYNYDKHPEHILPLLHYTAEESAQCAQSMADIKSLVEQAKAEFITGTRDIESGWDAYLNELEQCGLSDWMAIAQTAFERAQE